MKVEVKKDVILDSAYNKMPAQTINNIVANDTSAPKLLSAKHLGGTAVELTFDEPVNWTVAGSAIKIDQTAVAETVGVGSTLNSTVAGKYTYTVNAAAALSNGTHTVEVVNVNDFKASTANVDLLQKSTFTVADDTVQTTVTNVKAEGQYSFLITTSKPVASPAVTDLTIKKGNATLTPTTKYTVAAATDIDTTGKTLRVTLVADTASELNPVYGTNENTAALSVVYAGFKDSNGLVGKEYTGSVTLTKDAVAPKVVSENLIAYDPSTPATTTLTIPFDETLNATPTANKVSVIKDGAKVTPTSVTVSGKNLVLTFGAVLADGEYTIVLEEGTVKDTSNNNNAAVTLKHKVEQNSTNAAITVTFAPATYLNGKNVITATYAQTPTAATAAKAESYTIDGQELPAGTIVTLSGAVATIELPASYKVSAHGISAKLAVKPSTVKIATGQTDANKFVSASATEAKAVEGVVTLQDNVAPTLAKAEYVKNSAGLVEGIRLTFSEAVLANHSTPAPLADDFVIKQGAATLTYAVAAENAQDTASDKVVYLKLSSTLTVASGVTVTLGEEVNLTITDVSTNNKVTRFTGVAVQ